MPFDDDLPPPRVIREESKRIVSLRQKLIQIKRQRKVSQMQHILAHRISGNRDPYPEPAMQRNLPSSAPASKAAAKPPVRDIVREIDKTMRNPADKPATQEQLPVPDAPKAEDSAARLKRLLEEARTKNTPQQQPNAEPAPSKSESEPAPAESSKKPPLTEDPQARLRRLMEEARARKNEDEKPALPAPDLTTDAQASTANPETDDSRPAPANDLRRLLQEQRSKGEQLAKDKPEQAPNGADRLRQMLAEKRQNEKSEGEKSETPSSQEKATTTESLESQKPQPENTVAKPAAAAPPLIAAQSSAASASSRPEPPAIGGGSPVASAKPALSAQSARKKPVYETYTEPTRSQKWRAAIGRTFHQLLMLLLWLGLWLVVAFTTCKIILRFNILALEHWQDFGRYYETGAAIPWKFPVVWLVLLLLGVTGSVKVFRKPERLSKWWRRKR